jgi:hypothetical protein
MALTYFTAQRSSFCINLFHTLKPYSLIFARVIFVETKLALLLYAYYQKFGYVIEFKFLEYLNAWNSNVRSKQLDNNSTRRC